MTGTIVGNNKFFNGGIDTVIITSIDTSHVKIDVSARVYSQKHEISAIVQVAGGGFGWTVFAGHDIEFEGSDVLEGDIYSGHYIKNEPGCVVTGEQVEAPPYETHPVVDFDVYKTLAIDAGQYFISDISFTSGGSPYTGVWYTTGQANIENNAIINGTIVAEGDINLKGNNSIITATPANYAALLTGHDVDDIGDDITISGFVYAYNQFKTKGDNMNITGAVVSYAGRVSNEGANTTITYDDTYASNVFGISNTGGGGGSGATTVRVVSVYE